MKIAKLFFIAVLLLVFFEGKVFSQQNNITPGSGYKDVYIGMSIEALKNVLGEPTSIKSRKQEQETWEGAGYDTKKTLEFNIPFEQLYTYENDLRFAIWKIFINKGKVVYLNISSYIYESDVTKPLTLSGKINFYDNLEKITSVFGKDYFESIDEHSNGEYFYLSKGLRLIVNEGALRNIYVFTPFSAKQEKKFRKIISSKK